MKSLFNVIVLIGIMALIACAPPPPEKIDFEAIRSAIDQQNANFTEAVSTGDTAALASLYTEDAVLLPPGSDYIKGRNAIQQFYAEGFTMGEQTTVLSTESINGVNDLVYELGKYDWTLTLEDQTDTTFHGNYLVVWKKVEEVWMLHVDIWN
ncbi:MAG: SgcJ/EcaC family oxidoreductase [Bacteroidales bacterium]|nr:SgcJ/EcaC family oxidoreductase [Bacteroidales bacterium]